MSEIHDPTLASECPRREVIAELILFEMGVKSLEEVIVEGLSETALGSASKDFESQEDRIPDNAAWEQPPTAELLEGGDGELPDE